MEQCLVQGCTYSIHDADIGDNLLWTALILFFFVFCSTKHQQMRTVQFGKRTGIKKQKTEKLRKDNQRNGKKTNNDSYKFCIFHLCVTRGCFQFYFILFLASTV